MTDKKEKHIERRVPQQVDERRRIVEEIRQFILDEMTTPPVSLDHLDKLTTKYMEQAGVDANYHDWIMVLVNNALNETMVASIPHEKRILMIPQCLKDSAHCKSQIDEFGLLCERCGRCLINTFEAEAENLGMMTIVAEGFSGVIELVESGRIEAVIGVACLDSLEKVFPSLVQYAIPGIAIPLTRIGCKDTTVDDDMVLAAIRLKGDKIFSQIDIESIRAEVNTWFTPIALTKIMGEPKNEVEMIAYEWLATHGNRWRPSLLAATYLALSNDESFPDKVIAAAIAIECFHKASLVHDDIEDKDDYRYGDSTVHKQYGVPLAINIGDFLLGQGYCLIMSELFSIKEKGELGTSAAKAHKELCLGQGLDLALANNPDTATIGTIIDIAKLKTAPAFRTALDFGAILTGSSQRLRNTLARYSETLGIAYQLKDDMEDKNYLPKILQVIENKYDNYRNLAIQLPNEIENQRLRQFLFRLAFKMLH